MIQTRFLKGISLLEVLIAFTVLTVGVLAVMALFPNVMKNNRENYRKIELMNLAQERMDLLLSERGEIAGVEELSKNTVYNDPETDEDDVLGDNGFVRWWGESDPYGDYNIQIITVEVGYESPQGSGNFHFYKLVSAVNR